MLSNRTKQKPTNKGRSHSQENGNNRAILKDQHNVLKILKDIMATIILPHHHPHNYHQQNKETGDYETGLSSH